MFEYASMYAYVCLCVYVRVYVGIVLLKLYKIYYVAQVRIAQHLARYLGQQTGACIVHMHLPFCHKHNSYSQFSQVCQFPECCRVDKSNLIVIHAPRKYNKEGCRYTILFNLFIFFTFRTLCKIGDGNTRISLRYTIRRPFFYC